MTFSSIGHAASERQPNLLGAGDGGFYRRRRFHKLWSFLSVIFIVSIFPATTFAQNQDDDMVNLQEIRILSITWNVNSKLPKEDLRPLLGLNESVVDNPHFIAVGLQEMPLSASEIMLQDSWTEFLRKTMASYGYVKVKSIRMYAMSLIVFARHNLLLRIRDIETSWMRTGFRGWFGNKGGVTVRFSINGCHIAFVNCHLAAHEEQQYLEQRIQDYKSVVYGQEFKTEGRRRVLSHDHVVIMGDLNFRIDYLSGEDIINRIVERSDESRSQLLAKDQLNRVRSERTAFSEFDEAPVTFWPTFKFKVNTSIYDTKKRKPAFTDRVLFKKVSEVNVNDPVVPELYTSHPNFVTSDHKPVSSILRLKLFRKLHAIHTRDVADSAAVEQSLPMKMPALPQVDFHPIVNWKNDEDNEIRFSLKESDEDNEGPDQLKSFDKEWDWIAVFPSNFDSLDQWICYTWVIDAVPLTGQTSSSTPSTSRVGDGAGSTVDSLNYSLVMRCLLPPGGSYQLVYFHGEYTTSILGISEPFEIVEN